jgi:hypothetical protein
MLKKTKPLLLSVLAAFFVLMLIQAIPYGRNHANPPIVSEPSWDSPTTRALARRACFDCHSHATIWPWYSRVAPMSWLVQYDVDKGRRELNFSDWHNGAHEGKRPDKIREEITEGEMPPVAYRLAHPEARLTDAEKRRLADGLSAIAIGSDPLRQSR